MRQASDFPAQNHSLEQIGNVCSNLLCKARMIILDHAKWEANLARIAVVNILSL